MRNKIKKVLREALGVPKNLTETAGQIYKDIVKELSNYDFNEDDQSEKIELEVYGTYPVSDLTLKKLDLTIEVTYHPQAQEVLLLSVAVGQQAIVDPILPKIHSRVSDTVPLFFNFVAPENGNINEVIDFFDNNEREITKTISHELKHVYDYFKKSSESFRKRSDYKTYSGMKFGIPPLDEFMYFLYFTSAIENLVRPSEIAYLIQYDKVKRKDFLNFLEENNIYQTLKKIRNFSYEKLKGELKVYEQTINNVFEQVGEEPPSDLDEKIERFLDIFLITLNNARIQSLGELTFQSGLGGLFSMLFKGGNNEKQKYLERFEREIKRFKNAKDFFEFEEKKFKFVSDKILRKIYKLYDMTTVNESIVNWEMYHKYKTKKTPFTNEVKYDKIESKKMLEEKLKNQKNKK